MTQHWDDPAATVNPAQRHHAQAQWGEVGPVPANGDHGDLRSAIAAVVQQVTPAVQASVPAGSRIRIHIRELQVVIIKDSRMIGHIPIAALFSQEA